MKADRFCSYFSEVFSSHLHFQSRLPSAQHFGGFSFLIFDQKLKPFLKKHQPAWLQGFTAIYPVQAGEQLKELRALPEHFEKILALTWYFPRHSMCLVSLGGGSVGDFSGLTACLLKRGIRWVQIPSTWLAALDSSHGGKNALNALGMKNQIGTFYPSSDVFIVSSLLKSLPLERLQEASGELAKIALLDGGPWVSQLSKTKASMHVVMKTFLKEAIAAKMKIVCQDPEEKKGIRCFLNLGHTFGHFLEVQGTLSHGAAVAQGLFFALDMSLSQGILSFARFQKMNHFLEKTFHFKRLSKNPNWFKPSKQEAYDILKYDKKRKSIHKINFIGLKNFGKPQSLFLTVDELIQKAQQFGWLKS